MYSRDSWELSVPNAIVIIKRRLVCAIQVGVKLQVKWQGQYI